MLTLYRVSLGNDLLRKLYYPLFYNLKTEPGMVKCAIRYMQVWIISLLSLEWLQQTEGVYTGLGS